MPTASDRLHKLRDKAARWEANLRQNLAREVTDDRSDSTTAKSIRTQLGVIEEVFDVIGRA